MNHISPYRCVGWLSGALRQFCNFNLSFCVFFFLNKISRRTLGNYIYMCVIVLSYRWIILENNNIDSLYFFELIEFYKENILTSWNICLAKEVRFFSPFYVTFVFPCCEQNWMKYDSTSREIIRYHIFYRSLTNLVFPRILRKTFGGTSSIPILHHVLSKTRKSREIETFSWTNKRIFKYVYLRFFLMKLSKLIETRFWS